MLRFAEPVREMVSPPPRSRIPSATPKRPIASATAINASPATRASARRPCIRAFYTRIGKCAMPRSVEAPAVAGGERLEDPPSHDHAVHLLRAVSASAKPPPRLAEGVLQGNPDARVPHLAVRRPATPAMTHRRDGADDLHPGCVGRTLYLVPAV